MTTRVQANRRFKSVPVCRQQRMSALEKCMLRNAVFDPCDRVLDANVCSGQVAEYLLEHMECRVCGVSDRMEEVRRTRARLHNGDFVYAANGDIPWQDRAFDTVLLHPSDGNADTLLVQLKECCRVLKPGGQLVLGLRSLPCGVRKLSSFFLETSPEEELPSAENAKMLMQQCGFDHITRTCAGFSVSVLIGWKQSE